MPYAGFLAVAVMITGCSTGPSSAPEDPLAGYPAKPIKIIVNRGAGGGTDNTARIFADRLSQKLGSSVVVQNVTGGDGMIGANAGILADPDGYSLMVIGNSEVPSILVNSTGVEFTVDDVKPISNLVSRSDVFVAKAGSEHASLEDLIAFAKANPKRLTVGIPGGASEYKVDGITKALGIEVTVVNAADGNELYADLLGGHIDVGILGAQFYKRALDENLTVFADTGKRTESQAGSADTFLQQGYDYGDEEFTYLLAPKGTPDEIREYLSKVVGEVFSESDIKEAYEAIGNRADYIPLSEMEGMLKDYFDKAIPMYEDLKARAAK